MLLVGKLLLFIEFFYYNMLLRSTVNSAVGGSSQSVYVAGGKKRKRQESMDELDQALISRLDKLQDGEAAFGDHVASCLQQLNPRQRAITRVEIDKLLFNIQFPADTSSLHSDETLFELLPRF